MKNNLHFYQGLINQAQKLKPLKTAVVHPVDSFSLGGALKAAKEGLITPILIAPPHKLLSAAEAIGASLEEYEVIPVEHSHEAAQKGAALCGGGSAKAIMKGALHTDEFLEPILMFKNNLLTDRRLSHVAVFDIPSYPKPLFVSDVAINILPSLMEKKDIVQNAINLFRSIYPQKIPKVAIVSAVETVTEKMPSTLHAAALCKMADRGQITDGVLDGPLAFDNAISHQAAIMKGIVSPVAGDADIIIVPNIEAGNILYKQMHYLSNVQGASLVVGARVPIILTSRADESLAREASCALAVLYSQTFNTPYFP